MSDAFQNAVLAAAQQSGMVESDAPEPDVADAAAASAPEPDAAASPTEDLAPDADADDADDPEEGYDLDDEDDADEADDADSDDKTWEQRYRELAAQETQREAERLAAQQQASAREWAQSEANLDGWLRRSVGQLAAERANDERLIAASDDPQGLRAHLGALRQQTENWVWGQYRQQKQVYDQHKHGAVMQALAQSQIQNWAETTAQRFGLPKSASAQLLRYADGTPVHPDAMPARAAEIAEQRRVNRQYRRQLTQAQRSAAAAELRGTPAPGSGTPQGVPEFKSWRDQLAWAAEQHGLKP